MQNETINGHYMNIKFLCADVTSPDLAFTEGSLDLIFSNWLLMYLSDKEVIFVDSYSITWKKKAGVRRGKLAIDFNLFFPC